MLCDVSGLFSRYSQLFVLTAYIATPVTNTSVRMGMYKRTPRPKKAIAHNVFASNVLGSAGGKNKLDIRVDEFVHLSARRALTTSIVSKAMLAVEVSGKGKG